MIQISLMFGAIFLWFLCRFPAPPPNVLPQPPARPGQRHPWSSWQRLSWLHQGSQNFLHLWGVVSRVLCWPRGRVPGLSPLYPRVSQAKLHQALPYRDPVQPAVLHLWLVVQCGLQRGRGLLQHQWWELCSSSWCWQIEEGNINKSDNKSRSGYLPGSFRG